MMMVMMMVLCVVFLLKATATAEGTVPTIADRPYLTTKDFREENVIDGISPSSRVQEAIDLLTTLGVPRENLCIPASTIISTSATETSSHPLLPGCSTTSKITTVSQMPPAGVSKKATDTDTSTTTTTTNPKSNSWVRSRRQRYLQVTEGEDEDGNDEKGEGEGEEVHDRLFYITHALCAAACVIVAALAAGLTMGLLSLDPLLLLIKMRAGATKKEQEQAAMLLPIVKQHHLLLVTLLLLNSMANEALPLFLEVLVSPLVAVILSVTLVLFFGEIIPSAIFTGPNKIELASRMTPIVRAVMFLLYPLAYPIASMLDHLLHDDGASGDGHGGEEMGGAFNRGELSALVRIQYEERVAAKRQRKMERAKLRRQQYNHSATSDSLNQSNKSVPPSDSSPLYGQVQLIHPDHVGALDFSSSTKLSQRSSTMDAAIRASKREISRRQIDPLMPGSMPTLGALDETERESLDDSGDLLTPQNARSVSIHVDEVNIVEGALQMKTKMAMDVLTPVHSMFAIPESMIMSEPNVVSIYSSGYSRIPVYSVNPTKPKSHSSIVGILMTKQLIVVNPNDKRKLDTLPLSIPICVSPKINLIDLLNLFQTGRVGHMALVCARPNVGQEALNQRRPLPDGAGFMGIITLEDVIEALLQEQIYDETDKLEREAQRIALWATKKWKRYVRNRKRERQLRQQKGGGGDDGALSSDNVQRDVSIGTVVLEAINRNISNSSGGGDRAGATETTSLLSFGSRS